MILAFQIRMLRIAARTKRLLPHPPDTPTPLSSLIPTHQTYRAKKGRYFVMIVVMLVVIVVMLVVMRGKLWLPLRATPPLGEPTGLEQIRWIKVKRVKRQN